MITGQMGVGPFGFMDMVGLGTVTTIFHSMGEQSDDEQLKRNAAYLQENLINPGKLGVKSGEGFYTYPEPDFQRPDFLS